MDIENEHYNPDYNLIKLVHNNYKNNDISYVIIHNINNNTIVNSSQATQD